MGKRDNKLTVAGAAGAIVRPRLRVSRRSPPARTAPSTPASTRRAARSGWSTRDSTACPAGATHTCWAQRGRQGPTGYPAPQGHKGPPGKDGDSKKQWVRMDADGRVLATNNTSVQTYDVREPRVQRLRVLPGLRDAGEMRRRPSRRS